MDKLVLWIIFFVGLFLAYQAGWFDAVVQYFSDTEKYSRQEKVIENEDGSYSTVRYRNVIDIMTGK